MRFFEGAGRIVRAGPLKYSEGHLDGAPIFRYSPRALGCAMSPLGERMAPSSIG